MEFTYFSNRIMLFVFFDTAKTLSEKTGARLPKNINPFFNEFILLQNQHTRTVNKIISY